MTDNLPMEWLDENTYLVALKGLSKKSRVEKFQ